jgi:hypothetical protein
MIIQNGNYKNLNPHFGYKRGRPRFLIWISS